MGETGDKFLAAILALVESGFGLIQNDVFGLTSIMIMITFGMLGIKFVLAGEESKAVIGQFFMTVLYIGFLTWVIKNWPTLYDTIGSYFQNLGGVAGNVPDAGEMMKKPSRVLNSLDLAKAPIERSIDDLMGAWGGWGSIPNMGKVFSLWIALGFLEIAFILLYLNMFFAIVEFHLVSLAAWPFLAFSAFKGSAFLAERPLGFVFAAGAKLLVMTMVLGFSINYFDQALPPADPTIGQALDTAVMALLVMILGFAVPVVAAAMISGGPGLSAALPMMTAIGAAMAIKEGVAAVKAGATSAPVRSVASATAAAAGRANSNFGQSFSPGGAASMAMSAMRGGGMAKGSATAAAAGAGSGAKSSSAVSGMMKSSPSGGAWDGPPTVNQAGAAVKRGVNISGMTRGQASVALEEKGGMDPAWSGAKSSATATAAASGAANGRASSAVVGMKSAYNRGPSRSGKTDFLSRVRGAIPPGTEGSASGSAPRFSSDL